MYVAVYIQYVSVGFLFGFCAVCAVCAGAFFWFVCSAGNFLLESSIHNVWITDHASCLFDLPKKLERSRFTAATTIQMFWSFEGQDFRQFTAFLHLVRVWDNVFMDPGYFCETSLQILSHCLTAPVGSTHCMYGFLQFGLHNPPLDWHMLAFYLRPSPPFTRATALCHVTCSADTLDKSRHKSGQQVQLPNRYQSKVDQLRQPVSEMHGSIAFSESSEYYAPLQFWSRRSICRLYFCAKSHKLGINPWQGPRLHSLLTVFAPLHCTQWWKPKRRNPRLRVDVRNL